MILSTPSGLSGPFLAFVHGANRCVSATYVSGTEHNDRGPRQKPHLIPQRRGHKNAAKTTAYSSVYTVHTYIYELIERAGKAVVESIIIGSAQEPCPSVDTPILARIATALNRPIRSFTWRDGMARVVLADGRIAAGFGDTKADAWARPVSVLGEG